MTNHSMPVLINICEAKSLFYRSAPEVARNDIREKCCSLLMFHIEAERACGFPTICMTLKSFKSFNNSGGSCTMREHGDKSESSRFPFECWGRDICRDLLQVYKPRQASTSLKTFRIYFYSITPLLDVIINNEALIAAFTKFTFIQALLKAQAGSKVNANKATFMLLHLRRRHRRPSVKWVL